MGSASFLKVDETLQRLQISQATYYRMIKKGHLRPFREEGKTLGVLLEDVEAWERAQYTGSSPQEMLELPFNRESFVRMHTQLRMLQHQMDTVMKVLNIRYRKLEATDVELVNLYQTAQLYSKEYWPPHVEALWSEVFMTIRLEDIERLQKLTEDEAPWKPFYRFCYTMALKPHDKSLKEALLVGRANLYQIANTLNEAQGNMPRVLDSVIARDAAPLRRLLRIIEKSEKKASEKGTPVPR